MEKYNLKNYNKHSLSCPYCNEKYLYSSKIDKYFDFTNYECINCNYIFTGDWRERYFKNLNTKKIFYAQKNGDFWITKISRRVKKEKINFKNKRKSNTLWGGWTFKKYKSWVN